MSDPAAYAANLHRGVLLRETKRYGEACKFLAAAIEADPDNPTAYFELAQVKAAMSGGKKDAFNAIERAIQLAPNNAYYLGYKAFLFQHYGKHWDAIKLANEALAFDPYCYNALIAQVNAYTKLKKWNYAETVIRQILEYDPQNIEILNLLSQTLRIQGHQHAAQEVTAGLLARVPNNSFAQANAGWEALKRDDHIIAKRHFLDALRNDPECDYAHAGLLQSMRARIFVYQVAMKIGSVFAEVQGQGPMRIILPILSVMTGGLVLACILILLVVILTLQPLSNLFLLADPNARRAFKKKEWRSATITAAVMAALFGLFLWFGLYAPILELSAYFAAFALGVYVPQWYDSWQMRKMPSEAQVRDLDVTPYSG